MAVVSKIKLMRTQVVSYKPDPDRYPSDMSVEEMVELDSGQMAGPGDLGFIFGDDFGYDEKITYSIEEVEEEGEDEEEPE